MTKNKKTTLLPLLIIGSLFFILGFITWLNGMLIPTLKTACQLSNFAALFVAFAFYISYTIMALPAAAILKRTGFKKGMSLGLWIMSLGALIFIPAAYTRIYFLFLLGLFVLGTGMSLLQTAVNPYVTVIGSIESAAKRISFMGIANKIAGALAPMVLGFFVVKQGDEDMVSRLAQMDLDQKNLFLDDMALRVVLPYLAMALVLFLVGVGLRFANLPNIEEEDVDDTPEETPSNFNHQHILQYPQLVLGAIALFFYVGVEVIAGDTIINYGLSLDIPIETAKNFTSYTMVCMLLGYVIGIFTIPKYIQQKTALAISAILGIAFSLAVVMTSGVSSVYFVAILGFANALVWPAIWPLAIQGLGKHIKTGSAILIMAISGGAILPLLWGKVSDHLGSQTAYWVLIPGYVIILFYALYGHKLRKW